MLLLAPVRVTVSPLDYAAAARDGLAREGTARHRYRTSFDVCAQVDFADRVSNDDTLAGAQLVSRCELTFRRSDVDAARWTPQRGDRVTVHTDRSGRIDPVELYVDRSIPRGYWFGGATTVVVEASGRHPRRPSSSILWSADYSIDFDSQNDYLYAASSVLPTIDTWTVAAWLKLTGPRVPGRTHRILYAYGGGAPFAYVQLYVLTHSVNPIDYWYTILRYADGTTIGRSYGLTPIWDSWIFYAVTHGARLRWYLNDPTPIIDEVAYPTKSLTLTDTFVGGRDVAGQGWKGRLQSLATFSEEAASSTISDWIATPGRDWSRRSSVNEAYNPAYPGDSTATGGLVHSWVGGTHLEAHNMDLGDIVPDGPP